MAEPKCVCEFKKWPGMPVCNAPFNPNHPFAKHRGQACANEMEDLALCGHAPACHPEYQDQPQTTEVPDTQETVSE